MCSSSWGNYGFESVVAQRESVLGFQSRQRTVWQRMKLKDFQQRGREKEISISGQRFT
jgi:hypothetical protein